MFQLTLRRRGISDQAVLRAMEQVPRDLFVEAADRDDAYRDSALPIGFSQTISQPFVVARMVELVLQKEKTGRVLEVGTGCGYQAALLCRLGRRVVSVERLRPLHEKARTLVATMRETRLRLVYGDGVLGHPPGAPYDSIVAAAGGSEIPQAWLDQLAVGGRLVSPLQQPGARGQTLVVVDSTADSGFPPPQQVIIRVHVNPAPAPRASSGGGVFMTLFWVALCVIVAAFVFSWITGQ